MRRVEHSSAESADSPVRDASIASSGPSNKGSVALVDSAPMRRTCILRLLGVHLRDKTRGFADADDLLTEPSGQSCPLRAVIFSLGPRAVSESRIVERLPEIRAVLIAVPMIVLSDREDYPNVIHALRAGFNGYIPTSMAPPVAIKAIRIVLSGGRFFPASALPDRRPDTASPTPADAVPSVPSVPAARSDIVVDMMPPTPTAEGQEPWKNWPPLRLAVLDRLREGKANKTIADELGIDESNVKSHVRQIMRQLDVTNRTQVALYLSSRQSRPEAGDRLMLAREESCSEH